MYTSTWMIIFMVAIASKFCWYNAIREFYYDRKNIPIEKRADLETQVVDWYVSSKSNKFFEKKLSENKIPKTDWRSYFNARWSHLIGINLIMGIMIAGVLIESILSHD
ncbi:MAG: hypothetical protein VYD64_06950 [Pseudomonadota bacterium]|nr:hypothetical protein [Pseudomonadota bacterium]